MKKLLSTALIAVILSSTMVDTVSAAVERRVVRSGGAGRAGRQTQRRIARKRRSLPIPRGKTSPEQLRRIAQQAERDAKKLQDDAKKAQTRKVPEQTVVADAKKVEANIGKIEQQLANLRTWSGDVLPGGYSLEEKDVAFDIAAPYIKESEALKAHILSNQQKIDLITTKRYFGLGSPTVNKGKEDEYARYSKSIITDEARLAKLEPIIAQQELIMGKRRSNAIKAAYGMMATAAIAVGADFFTGGALSAAAATQVSSIATNVAYYTPSPISWAAGQIYGAGAAGAAKLKAGWDYFRGTTPQQKTPTGEQPSIIGQLAPTGGQINAIVSDAVASLAKDNVESWTNSFGKEIADTASAMFSIVARAGATILVEEGTKLAYLQAAEVLGNPKATPADAEKALNRLKNAIDKVAREKEKAAKEEQAAKYKATRDKAYENRPQEPRSVQR